MATVTVDYRYPVLTYSCTEVIKVGACKAWLDGHIEELDIFARRQR